MKIYQWVEIKQHNREWVKKNKREISISQKGKWRHNIPKPVGCCKNDFQDRILVITFYSKISNKLSNFSHQRARKRNSPKLGKGREKQISQQKQRSKNKNKAMKR